MRLAVANWHALLCTTSLIKIPQVCLMIAFIIFGTIIVNKLPFCDHCTSTSTCCRRLWLTITTTLLTVREINFRRHNWCIWYPLNHIFRTIIGYHTIGEYTTCCRQHTLNHKEISFHRHTCSIYLKVQLHAYFLTTLRWVYNQLPPPAQGI